MDIVDPGDDSDDKEFATDGGALSQGYDGEDEPEGESASRLEALRLVPRRHLAVAMFLIGLFVGASGTAAVAFL